MGNSVYRVVLYQIDWQVRRIDCQSARELEHGGWSTVEGTEYNLDRLQRYLYTPAIGYDEKAVREYRINNCLNAVHMGWRGCNITDERITKLVGWREIHTLKDDWVRGCKNTASKWSWERCRKEVQAAKLSRATWDYLYKDLKRRASRGSERTRPELHKFIGCMDLARPQEK